MRSIDSYDSRYPSAYYEVGTVYSFYGSNIVTNLKEASATQIQKYSSKLLELQEDSSDNAIKAVGSSTKKNKVQLYQRYYGVVVGKPNSQTIDVMILSVQNGEKLYFVKSYVVSFSGCSTDGTERMPVSPIADYSNGEKSKNIGGITRSKNNSGVGGIKRISENTDTSSGIGGIKRVNNSANDSSLSTRQPVQNVGGIKRINKSNDSLNTEQAGSVGGIKRIKK